MRHDVFHSLLHQPDGVVDNRLGQIAFSNDADEPFGVVGDDEGAQTITQVIDACGDGVSVLDGSFGIVVAVVTCAPDEGIVEALYMMNSRHIRHLLILDRDRLAGVISIGDVTGKWIELLELENRQLRDPVS